jgi:hypothetical protein
VFTQTFSNERHHERLKKDSQRCRSKSNEKNKKSNRNYKKCSVVKRRAKETIRNTSSSSRISGSRAALTAIISTGDALKDPSGDVLRGEEREFALNE